MALPIKLDRGPQGVPGGAAAPYKPRAKRQSKMAPGGAMPRRKQLNPAALANDMKQRQNSNRVADGGMRTFQNAAKTAKKASQYAARAARGQ